MVSHARPPRGTGFGFGHADRMGLSEEKEDPGR
jgi:hypothetical protein